MSLNVKLRQYLPETDFEGVFAFARDLISAPPYDAARRELWVYPQRDHTARVAILPEGLIVGFCAATHPYWNGVAIIDYLVVESRARREGVGSRLVREIESTLQESHLRHTCVQTASWNEDAIRFYERLGYVRRALLPEYFGTGNDLVWLDRSLSV